MRRLDAVPLPTLTSQGSGGTASFGSCGGGDGPISGGSEGADNDITVVGEHLDRLAQAVDGGHSWRLACFRSQPPAGQRGIDWTILVVSQALVKILCSARNMHRSPRDEATDCDFTT